MNVDFDGIRQNLVDDYNDLIDELHRHIQPDGETFGDGIPEGDTFVTGDINDQIDGLRTSIAILACIYNDDADVKPLPDIDLRVFNSNSD